MVTLAKLPAADAAEYQLMDVDRTFLAEYGPQQHWQPYQREQYDTAIAAIHARYAKQVAS